MAASMGSRCLSFCNNVSKGLPILASSTRFLLRNTVPTSCLNVISVFSKRFTPTITGACLHTSAPRRGLNEFFDKDENVGEQSVRVGRPWKVDELRIKSNEDLHKLWYVLLKERNMLMTMAEEYKRNCELFPSPERVEKVEESMENLLDVVAERDRAFSLLETGESCEPGRRWAYNELGIGFWQKCKEHFVPLNMNARWRRTTLNNGAWQQKFLKLRREMMLGERRRKLLRIRARYLDQKRVFPDADIETDLSEFQNPITSTMKGPQSQ